VQPDATDGFDALFDSPRPPAPPTDASVSIAFQSASALPLARDIRNGETAVWQALVHASHPGMVTLSWPRPDASVSVFLLDEGNGVRLALRDHQSYTFAQQGSDTHLRFEMQKAATEQLGQPTGITLEQNHPNPFSSSTTIRYSLDKETRITVKVCDVYGREVATLVDGVQAAGKHEAVFHAPRLPAGLYLLRLETEEGVLFGRLLLTK
jgi:hypothetical protein